VYPPGSVELEFTHVVHNDDDDEVAVSGKWMQMKLQVLRNGEVQSQSVDKAEVLPFEPVRYVAAQANRPLQSSFAIAVGQLLPAICLNSSQRGLTDHFFRVLKAYQKNGFVLRDVFHHVLRKIRATDFSELTELNVATAWKVAMRRVSR
jgi:hypothetical protein